MLRPPEGNATIAAGHGGPAQVGRCEVVVGFGVDVEIDGSQGCQAFLRDDVAA